MTEEEKFNNPDYNNPNSINYRVKLDGIENSNKPVKPYLGDFKEKFRKNGDSFFTGEVSREDFNNIPDEYFKLKGDGKNYVKLVLNKYIKGPTEFGETHSFSVDTFTFKKEEE